MYRAIQALPACGEHRRDGDERERKGGGSRSNHHRRPALGQDPDQLQRFVDVHPAVPEDGDTLSVGSEMRASHAVTEKVGDRDPARVCRSVPVEIDQQGGPTTRGKSDARQVMEQQISLTANGKD